MMPTVLVNDTNVTSNSTSEIDSDNESFSPIVIVIGTIVTLFILTSNIFALVFLCRLKNEKLKKRICMIMNLTYSDLVIGISALILTLRFFVKSIYTDNGCKIVIFLAEFGATASLFQTFCICLERYLAVKAVPIQQQLFGTRGRNVLLIISWIVIGAYFGCLKLFSPSSISHCTYPNLYGEYYDVILKLNSLVVFMPLLIITIVLYIVTLFKLKYKLKIQFFSTWQQPVDVSTQTEANPQIINREDEPNNEGAKRFFQGATTSSEQYLTVSKVHNAEFQSSQDDVTREEVSDSSVTPLRKAASRSDIHIEQTKRRGITNFKLKAMRNVGIVILVFMLSTGIGISIFVVESLCFCKIYKNVRTLATFTWLINSAFNPIIYIFTIPEFRKVVLNILKFKSSYYS